MKKYHLYLWLTALVGLFAACSQDESDALQTANDANRVTFTASLPADFAQLGTRANEVPAFPANYKLRCILEVWDEELTTLKVRKEVCPAAGAAKIDFTFELDNGKYNALLWANYIPESAGASPATIAGLSGVEHYDDFYYLTDTDAGLKEVQMSGMTFDCKLQDAFCAAKPFTKEATALKDLTVTLARPLTKLTIAEKNTTNFGYCREVTPTYNVPNKLDVSTGTVSGSIKIIIGYNSANSGFGDDITVNGTPCKVLCSSYIFAEADGTMPEIKLEFTATTESGKVLPNVTIPAGIPVKRNHRINAAGTLIVAQDVPSKAVNMSVDINSGWAEPDENKDIVPVVEAKVGDYFYKDGTWSTDLNAGKTCIGVIFQVNADGRSGKIVSLKESDTELAWATSGTQYATQVTNAINEKDGTANMAAIKTLDTDYSDFPAFKWCADKQDGGLAWYLPAVHELQDLYAASCGLTIVDANPDAQAGEVERWAIIGGGNYLSGDSNYASQREAFKLRITAANGSELGDYLSSVEESKNYVYKISCTINGSGTGGSVSKTATTKKVRAIAKFPKP